jgi:hypothetical protein
VIATLSEYRTYVAFAFIAIIGCAALLYRTDYTSYQTIQTQIAQMNDQHEADLRLFASEQKLRTEYAALHRKYANIDDDTSTTQARFVQYLHDLCRKEHVTIRQIDFHPMGNDQKSVPKKVATNFPGDVPLTAANIPADLFIQIPARVKLFGTYRDILLVMAHMSTPPYLIQVSDPEISRELKGLQATFDVAILRPSAAAMTATGMMGGAQ